MDFIDFLKVILFGIVEGITEWLPVSSTGHMIVLEDFLNLSGKFSEQFFDFFLVAIQLGAIFAVIFSFFKKINPFDRKKNIYEKKMTYKNLLKVFIACLPAAIIGFLFDDVISKYLNNTYVVASTLIIYGVLFILIEIYNKRRYFKINTLNEMSYKVAFLIGIAQLLALIPGTSRSGVTILAAMLLFANRTVAAEFSFLLSIPIMLGASGLKGIKYITKYSINMDQIMLLLTGMIVAFIVSIIVIRFLMGFIKKHDFKVFGYYRIVFGILLLILLLTKVIN